MKLYLLYLFSIKIQREISNNIQVAESLIPLIDVSAVSCIDNTSNLKDVFAKVDKLGDLWGTGTADTSLMRYIPGLSNVSRQGKIFNIVQKKAYASTYSDKKHTHTRTHKKHTHKKHTHQAYNKKHMHTIKKAYASTYSDKKYSNLQLS